MVPFHALREAWVKRTRALLSSPAMIARHFRNVCAIAATWVVSLALSALVFSRLVPDGQRRIGDYFFEADEAVRRGLDGHLASLYDTDPPALMWPFAIVVRLPVVLVGEFWDIGAWVSERSGLVATDRDVRYTLGAIACMATSATLVAVGVWSAAHDIRRIQRGLLSLLATAVWTLNPLAANSLQWGHPEELLMAGLIAGSLLILPRHQTAAVILFALALATKQPAWLALPAFVLLIAPGRRRRALFVGAATLLVATVPWTLLSLDAFMRQNSWATGIVPDSAKQIQLWRLLGDGQSFGARHSHLILLVVILGLTAIIGRRHRWHLPLPQGAALVAAIFLLRCLLDAVNIEYYALPALAGVLVLELSLTPPRIRVAPLVTLAVAVLLVLVSYGSLGALVDGYENDAYLLIVLALSAIALSIAAATDTDVSLRRLAGAPGRHRGVVALSAVGAVVVACGVLGLSTYQLSQRVLAPPLGSYAVSEGSLAQVTQPVAVLSPAAEATERLFALPLKPRPDRTYATAIYRYHDGGTVSVQSADTPGARSQVAEKIAHCDIRCSRLEHLITTPIGPGLWRGDTRNWAVSVPIENGRMITVSGTDAPPPGKVVTELGIIGRARIVPTRLSLP